MKQLTLIAAATAALAVAGLTAPAQARVYVGIDIPLVGVAPPAPPPPVVEYAPGPAPAAGYVWVPGYRAWNGYNYVWVAVGVTRRITAPLGLAQAGNTGTAAGGGAAVIGANCNSLSY